MTEVLKKKTIFAILNKEIERVQSLAPNVWGLSRDDIITAIENIRKEVEELLDE
jgi:hypothetical protein